MAKPDKSPTPGHKPEMVHPYLIRPGRSGFFKLGGKSHFPCLLFNPEGVELIDPRFGQRQKMARAEIEPQWENRIVYLEIAE